MYICAGLIEKRGDMLYNTAILLGRDGKPVGQYSKVHLYWPEVVFNGETPGDEHPIFELDFGRVGIVICYDNWYPAAYQVLALKGAELVLFPNAGHEKLTLPARAIDNGVYIACSAFCDGMESAIIDTLGRLLVHTNEMGAVVAAEIDLSKRPLPHANAGGNMNPGCGGRRGVRNSRSQKLYEEICKEMRQWENRPEPYTWLK
jgi:predicted amidohydrolase